MTEILKLNPRADVVFVAQLAGYISKYAKQFKTDPRISVAIAMQETAFVNKNRQGTVVTKDGRFVQGVTDVGVFQIHVDTIRDLGIDYERLKRDVDYQTFWHVKILAQKIKMCRSQRERFQVELGNEWSCYHSVTPSKRLEYVTDVGAHLAKLEKL